MSTTLDDLLSALETALTNTQETLRRRNNEIETGISHRDDFLVSESGHGEPFSLPEATLRARRRHQVSMLSLSCECRLRRTRPFSRTQAYLLRVMGKEEALRASRSFWRTTPRKLKIVFRGSEHPLGEVWLDGTLLTSTASEDNQPEQQERPTPEDSQLTRLLKRLFRFTYPKGYILSTDQSARVRQIMQQEKPAAS